MYLRTSIFTGRCRPADPTWLAEDNSIHFQRQEPAVTASPDKALGYAFKSAVSNFALELSRVPVLRTVVWTKDNRLAAGLLCGLHVH